MNPILKQFYDNKSMRETVKAFMIENLKEMSWKSAFEGTDVSGIHEAATLVDRTFDKLDEIYGKITGKGIPNSR